MVAEHSSAT